MSKELLQRVIDNGVEGNLNVFFQSAAKHYAEIEEDLTEFDDPKIGLSGFRTIGEMEFSPAEKLVVVTAKVDNDLTERSGKKNQYEQAKTIIKRLMRYDAGIFAFSDPSGNFRLSLVYGTPDAKRTVWNNFRRFTYFVSASQTNNTFKKRIGECNFSNLEAIKDAFSVEKVTKDFYKQIADWYFWAVHNTVFPKDSEIEPNGRNNAVIRLITRLIFIWFMKERKLVSVDLFNQGKTAALLKSLKDGETTYYKAILQNLFFATLNTRMDKREFRFAKSGYKGINNDYMNHGVYRYEDFFKNQQDMLVIFKDIPFLNGGLFDCLDWAAKESGTGAEVRFDGFSDKEVGLSVPNYLFFSGEQEADLNVDYGTKNKKYRVQGLLNILSAYNFTIDENDPSDSEVALDPELLGKVFENLLASFNPETATTARKATGSYYTPREIVDYMVTQSLRQYYKTHLADVPDIETKLDELLAPITGEPKNPFNEADSRRVVKLTEELRIVDPAVGSGAFPMGILNKLVSVLARVDRDNRLWKEAQLKAVEGVTDQPLKQRLIAQINESFSKKSFNYGRKLYLIEKCIYGVDIQPIAIEIAKLRFFIALLVDETIDKANPDNWGIVPLPNLDFKLMQGNSLISDFVGIDLDADDSASPAKLMKNETEELIAQFQTQKGRFQSAADRDEKKKLKDEIEKLIIRIFESKIQTQKTEYYTKLKNIQRKYALVPDAKQREESIRKDTETLNKNYKFDLPQAEAQLRQFTSGHKVKPFFAWNLYFAEVFHEKHGFDIVIANPPYIEHKKLKALSSAMKDSYQTYSGTADLYVYFYEKGLNLLRDRGVLTFISSNKFIKTSYGEKLRELLSSFAIHQVIDFTQVHVFDALVASCIIVILRDSPADDIIFADIDDKLLLNSLASCVQENYLMLKAAKLKSDIWLLENDTKLQVKAKIENNSQKLSNIENICVYRGVTTGYNPAFIIDESTRKSILESSSNPSKIIKPLIQGRDIRRWTYIPSSRYLIFTKQGIDIDSYPPIKTHLLKYRDDLKPRTTETDRGRKPGNYKWFEIQDNTAYYLEFEKEKIVWGLTADKWAFAYDDQNHYLPSNGYILTSSQIAVKYILALLNSRLLQFYFGFIGIMTAGGAFTLKHETIGELPIKINSIHHRKVERLVAVVDQILSITKADDYLSKPEKQAKVKEYECQIDRLVYELYGLTEEEIGVVEGT